MDHFTKQVLIRRSKIMIEAVLCRIVSLMALAIIIVRGNHFQGGTITYKIVNTSGSTVSIMITQTYLYKWATIYCDNAYILSQSTPNITNFNEYNYTLNCVANCTTAGGYKPVPVRSYCTDYSAPMAISVTSRTDIVNLTAGAYFTVAFTSSAWRTLSLPKGNASTKDWSVSCTIDLRARSDTGKVNTPPVATMISPIYIRVGVRTPLVIPTIDGDNDQVRCRFAQNYTECGDVCPPSSLPNGTQIISSNCTMLITGAKVNDWYAVTMQIEDFASPNSTAPLSSVPVQFLINVYDTPSCPIAPVLYGQSNQTGTCKNVQVGHPYSMTLYAINYCTIYSVTIKDIATLSFPIVVKTNLTKVSTSLYSVSLTWTPTASQIGSQILCAVALDSQNVQSNQYCTSFVVNENNVTACPGEVTSTTTSTTTTVTTTLVTTEIRLTSTHSSITTTEVTTIDIHSTSESTQVTIEATRSFWSTTVTTTLNTQSIPSSIHTAYETSMATTMSIASTTDGVQIIMVTTMDSHSLISDDASTSNEMPTPTEVEAVTTTAPEPSYQSISLPDESTTVATSSMTVVLYPASTAASSSGPWSWLLPLIIALGLLLTLLCCLCLCCPPPYGLGLLCAKQRARVVSQPPLDDHKHRIPRMFMVSATVGNALMDSGGSGSSTARSTDTIRSDIWLDLLPSTPRFDQTEMSTTGPILRNSSARR